MWWHVLGFVSMACNHEHLRCAPKDIFGENVSRWFDNAFIKKWWTLETELLDLLCFKWIYRNRSSDFWPNKQISSQHAIGQCATGEWFGVPFIPLLFARMALQWSEIIHLKCIIKKILSSKLAKIRFFYLWKLDLAEILRTRTLKSEIVLRGLMVIA